MTSHGIRAATSGRFLVADICLPICNSPDTPLPSDFMILVLNAVEVDIEFWGKTYVVRPFLLDPSGTEDGEFFVISETHGLESGDLPVSNGWRILPGALSNGIARSIENSGLGRLCHSMETEPRLSESANDSDPDLANS